MATTPLLPCDPRDRAILYVEDDPDTRDAVAAVLGLEGYRVTTAATLADGLRALASDRFDLVMSDYELPDGTGASLLATGRANGSLSDTPTLIVTALPGHVAIVGVPVIRKPVTPAELLAIVRTAMGVTR